MLVRAIWLSIFIIAAQPALADSAGKRETLATQTCLTEHPNAEHLCFNIAFYTCMGEQLAIAANPNLAEERCLFQEQFVWGNLIEKACNEFKSIFEVETTKWDTLCHNNNGINWSDFTKEIKQPEWDRGLPNYSLRLRAQSIRLHAIELRTLLAAYNDNK